MGGESRQLLRYTLAKRSRRDKSEQVARTGEWDQTRVGVHCHVLRRRYLRSSISTNAILDNVRTVPFEAGRKLKNRVPRELRLLWTSCRGIFCRFALSHPQPPSLDAKVAAATGMI